MSNNLQALLQNPQFKEKIKAAADQSVVIDLLLMAGAEKGYNFTREKILQFFGELNSTFHELNEDDLLIVNGGVPPYTKQRYCTIDAICKGD
jgi:hypothetical protein